jgi:hypothetical protein
MRIVIFLFSLKVYHDQATFSIHADRYIFLPMSNDLSGETDMTHPIDSITPAMIERNMRHAHELRSRAILDAFAATGRGLRRRLHSAVAIFA